MKYIIKLSFLALLFASIVSCDSNELDKEPVVSANGFEVVKDANITAPSVILDVLNNNVFGKYNWGVADNGISSVSTYQLVIFDHDNDPLLENGVVYSGSGVQVTTESRNASLTVKEFNDMVNLLPTFKCGQMNVDVRIKSVLGLESTNGFIQYSNPITYVVTPYSTKLLELSFAKDANSAKTASKILSSSYSVNTDYEGYMYLTPGNYMFYQPDACGDYTAATAYGGASGTLSTTAPSITIATEGYYFVKANLTTNAYSVSQFTTFGIFGNATRTGLGTGNHVPMTYNSSTNKWELTIKLIIGKNFRFKSNLWSGNTSDLIVPPPNPLHPEYELNPPYVSGSASSAVSVLGKSAAANTLEHDLLVNTDKEITVPGTFVTSPDPTRKLYKITLDVSNPRKYTYTLTAVN